MTVNQGLSWLESLWQKLSHLRCVLFGAPGAKGLDLRLPCRANLPWLQTAAGAAPSPYPLWESVAPASGKHHPRTERLAHFITKHLKLLNPSA